jgi:hypothetical protein
MNFEEAAVTFVLPRGSRVGKIKPQPLCMRETEFRPMFFSSFFAFDVSLTHCLLDAEHLQRRQQQQQQKNQSSHCNLLCT